MTSPFARSIAVAAVGSGTWSVALDGDYAFGDKLNGGYLLAIAARAAAEQVHDSDPGRSDARLVQATARYLTASPAGPGLVTTTVLSASRRLVTVRCAMSAGEHTTLEATVTFASGAMVEGGSWTRESAPEIPPPAECTTMADRTASGHHVPLLSVVRLLLDPRTSGFDSGRPSGTGELRAWFEIPEQDRLDAYGLILASDVMPPASLDLGHDGWTPTLTLDVHVLASPSPGPVRVRQRVGGIVGGLLTQLCDVWDRDGTLVAHATQLAVVPTR